MAQTIVYVDAFENIVAKIAEDLAMIEKLRSKEEEGRVHRLQNIYRTKEWKSFELPKDGRKLWIVDENREYDIGVGSHFIKSNGFEKPSDLDNLIHDVVISRDSPYMMMSTRMSRRDGRMGGTRLTSPKDVKEFDSKFKTVYADDVNRRFEKFIDVFSVDFSSDIVVVLIDTLKGCKLPLYREEMSVYDVHMDIASKLKDILDRLHKYCYFYGTSTFCSVVDNVAQYSKNFMFRSLISFEDMAYAIFPIGERRTFYSKPIAMYKLDKFIRSRIGK